MPRTRNSENRGYPKSWRFRYDTYYYRVPKGQEQRIAKLSLTIAANGAILSITIDEKDGARTVFEFTKEEANPAIPESAFHFTPPTGVPVVDSLPPV